MIYRPEVDGLRAVAILPVVLYHAGIPGFSGGFVGVDVFFVISGYLIASIIIGEVRRGQFSLLNFYERRIRRIFPALFVMMAVSYPLAWLLLSPMAMKQFSGSVAASTTFVANIYFLSVSGYFATAAELKPLLHNWSLSVEEQFYLIFPAAVLLSWRLGTKLQVCLFAAAALASLSFAQWQIAQGDSSRAFFLLQTRLWELLAGVLTAYWLASDSGQSMLHSGRFRRFGILGLGAILYAIVIYNADTPFPGVAALLPCAGAVMIIAFTTPQSLAGRLLSSWPMVFVGLVSYSLYLWHYPILAFTRIATGTESRWMLLAACGAAFLLSCITWRYVEQPLRKMRFPSPFLFIGVTASSAALLGGLGMLGFMSDGYREHYVAHRLDPVVRANFEKFQPQTQPQVIQDEGCWFSAERPDAAFESRFVECAERYGKAVLVFGDSHAGNIYRALRASGRVPFLVALWRGGCRPYKPKPECPYEAVGSFLDKHTASVSQVVFHISGSHLILDHLGEGDSNAAFVPGNPVSFDLANIRNTADYLAGLPKGPDLVWLGPFAEARIDLDDPASFSPERLRFNTVSLDLFAQLDTIIRAEVQGSKAFRYASLIDVLDFNANTLLRGDCMTFSDVDHLSSCGEQLFSPNIATILE